MIKRAINNNKSAFKSDIIPFFSYSKVSYLANIILGNFCTPAFPILGCNTNTVFIPIFCIHII